LLPHHDPSVSASQSVVGTLQLYLYKQFTCFDTSTLIGSKKKAQLMQGLCAKLWPFFISRQPSAAILDFIEPEIAPFNPPTPKTLA